MLVAGSITPPPPVVVGPYSSDRLGARMSRDLVARKRTSGMISQVSAAFPRRHGQRVVALAPSERIVRTTHGAVELHRDFAAVTSFRNGNVRLDVTLRHLAFTGKRLTVERVKPGAPPGSAGSPFESGSASPDSSCLRYSTPPASCTAPAGSSNRSPCTLAAAMFSRMDVVWNPGGVT